GGEKPQNSLFIFYQQYRDRWSRNRHGFHSHLYSEFSAIGRVVHAQPSPHILLYDGFRHEQTDPCSPLRPLGGKVGVEDLPHDPLRYAPGAVGHGYDSLVPLSEYGDRNPAIVHFPF